MSWIEEQYKGTQQTGSDGRVGGKGLGAFFWQQFVDEDKINKGSQRDLNTQTAIGLGEDINDLTGITDTSSALDVKGAAIKRGRERTKETKDEDRTYARTVTSDNQKPLMAQIAQQTKASSDQLQLAREQGNNQMELSRMESAKSDKRFYASQAEARDARADDLMFRRETMERADRKDERNRRRDSIAALTSGLAALGAAFAL
jgi:hypothetical protein